MRWEPIHETPFVLYGVVVQGRDWIQWMWTVMLFSRMFSSKPHKMTRCGSLAFRPIWNSWHKADKWVCEFWGEAVKGSGRQGGVFLFFFSLTPLKRTPGKFGRLTAEVEPAATKQEGECFHVFMCVFSFTPGTYIYTYIYVAAGLSQALSWVWWGFTQGYKTRPGDDLWNTLIILQAAMLLRCGPPATLHPQCAESVEGRNPESIPDTNMEKSLFGVNIRANIILPERNHGEHLWPGSESAETKSPKTFSAPSKQRYIK